MIVIDVSSLYTGVRATCSMAKKQPLKTLSFLSKLLTVKNSQLNLNKPTMPSQETKIQAERAGGRQAPPRPVQPALDKLLRMALTDFKQDPEAAKKKWIREGTS